MPRRTKEELIESLNEHINFIKKSAKDYDEGDKSEAKRLANSIDILVHDRGATKSILTNLNLLNKLKFCSLKHITAPGNLFSEAPLCYMHVIYDSIVTPPIFNIEYKPLFDDVNVIGIRLAFSKWWEEPIFYIRGKNYQEITRKKLICIMRDKDGGAHLDEILPQHYKNLISGEALGWQYGLNEENSKFVSSPHYPSVRQIAHELLRTIEPVFKVL